MLRRMISSLARRQQETVVVRPVASRSDYRRFLSLPWRVNAQDRLWVPPLLRDVRAVLSSSHPFHRHAEVQCFLAWRGSEAVGRVAAIINRGHTEFHNEPVGFFGLFECDHDAEAARALLETAANVARDRNLDILRGPFNLSTNEELASPGVLIEGFHRPPCLLMSHNPPYYAELMEAAGFGKAKDTFAYWISDAERLSQRLQQGLGKVEPHRGLRIRSVDMERLDAEVALIQEIYNDAWSRNWGFIPMTAEEVGYLAGKLRPIVDPRLCVIAEIDGEPVAFGLAIPNFNQALKHINGRLYPFGLLKLLWYRRSIDEARMIALGVKSAYRHKGLDAMIIMRVFTEATRMGIRQGECSAILEDNAAMRRGVERIGAVADKTYRIYERRIRS
jgi:GNAT superfamily N-acetyltransferase